MLSFDQARLIRQNQILAANGIDPSGMQRNHRLPLTHTLTTRGVYRYAARREGRDSSLISHAMLYLPHTFVSALFQPCSLLLCLSRACSFVALIRPLSVPRLLLVIKRKLCTLSRYIFSLVIADNDPTTKPPGA
jgi:hypothetical protein